MGFSNKSAGFNWAGLLPAQIRYHNSTTLLCRKGVTEVHTILCGMNKVTYQNKQSKETDFPHTEYCNWIPLH